MNQIEQNTITSLEVSEMIGKEHKELLRDIRRYIEQLGESKIAQTDFFILGTYANSQNKVLPCYKVTKKGCEFIGNKLIGVKGTEFTAKYINKFHDMEQTIIEQFNGLSKEMQALIMHDKKIQAVVDHIKNTNERVDKLENNMTIDYNQQKELKSNVQSKVWHVLGGRASQASKDKYLKSRVYSRLWHDFYDFFGINAYANTPVVRYAEAKEYIMKWKPSTNMRLEIDAANKEDLV